MKNLNKKNQGQGILEAMIAISFIASGVLAVLALVISNVKVSTSSNLYTQASTLAWEGVEVVRMMRDSNWLAGEAFNNGIDSPGSDNTAIAVFDDANNTWSLDYTPNTIMLDSETQFYNKGRLFLQFSGVPSPTLRETPFFRLIKTIPQGPSAVQIISEVRWEEQNGIKSLQAEEWIYDWR